MLWIKGRSAKLKECFVKPLFWDHQLHVNLLSKNSSQTVAVKRLTCKLCMTCTVKMCLGSCGQKVNVTEKKKKSLMKSLFTSNILPRLHCCISKVRHIRASFFCTVHREFFFALEVCQLVIVFGMCICGYHFSFAGLKHRYYFQGEI